jgi:putative transcriptional regulator
MVEHKIKIVDVAKQTGMNRDTVTLLYNEIAQRIYLDTIEKLCKLFQCEVGELLKFEQDK